MAATTPACAAGRSRAGLPGSSATRSAASRRASPPSSWPGSSIIPRASSSRSCGRASFATCGEKSRKSGSMLAGFVHAELGQGELAIAQIRRGLAAYGSTGAHLFVPYFLSLLARACLKLGQLDEGLRVIGEALERARTTGERVWEAELIRLEGELRLAAAPDDVAEALDCFRHAIEIARRQAARSWELRATSSLARLLVAAGRRDEAGRTLAGVYDWFTEG